MLRPYVRTSGLMLALLCALALVACGPVTSTMSINDAEIALERARLEGAERYAVYEYVSAVEYLGKAREEWGYSDYQHAEEYADKAIDFAESALARTVATPNRNLQELDGETF